MSVRKSLNGVCKGESPDHGHHRILLCDGMMETNVGLWGGVGTHRLHGIVAKWLTSRYVAGRGADTRVVKHRRKIARYCTETHPQPTGSGMFETPHRGDSTVEK